MNSAAKTGNFLLDAVFPVHCLRCGEETLFEKEYACEHCNPPEPPSSFSCPVCEKRLPVGIVCEGCRRTTNLRRFFFAGNYADAYLRKLIHQYKYGKGKMLYRELSRLLSRALKTHGIDSEFRASKEHIVVAPVPLTKRKQRERGFNQSEKIAEYLAEEFGLEIRCDTLKRTREHVPQAEITDRKTRKQNVSGSFSCSNPDAVRKKIVMLVDDVYTSGATMEECARVLKMAGAKEIWGAVIAKG